MVAMKVFLLIVSMACLSLDKTGHKSVGWMVVCWEVWLVKRMDYYLVES